MWECLSLAWAWLGSNSGQVQIVIGIFAFWVAYKGYIKLLEHRSIDSKMVFYSLLHEAYRENIKYSQHARKLEIIANDLKKIDTLLKADKDRIENNLEHIVKWKAKLKEIKVELEKIYELPTKLKLHILEESALGLNYSLKEFVRASNGFNTIENDLERLKAKYKNNVK